MACAESLFDQLVAVPFGARMIGQIGGAIFGVLLIVDTVEGTTSCGSDSLLDGTIATTRCMAVKWRS